MNQPKPFCLEAQINTEDFLPFNKYAGMFVWFTIVLIL